MNDELEHQSLKKFFAKCKIWMEIEHYAFIIIFTIENSDGDLRKIRKTESYNRLCALLGIAKNESADKNK